MNSEALKSIRRRAEPYAKKRAREQAATMMWSLNNIMLMYMVLMVVLFLQFKGYATEIVALLRYSV